MNFRKRQMFSPNGARGFSLVEVMVALVVLSVGMIGLAALHGQSLSAGRTALFRSIAINLSADMADRIRVNRLAQGAYAGGAANNNCDPAGGGGVDCLPAQMAAHDLFMWNQAVQQLLPNGQGQVLFNNGTNPPTYTINVSWDQVGEPAPLLHQITFQQPTF
jgi:type IV pilus assembly protein PilV